MSHVRVVSSCLSTLSHATRHSRLNRRILSLSLLGRRRGRRQVQHLYACVRCHDSAIICTYLHLFQQLQSLLRADSILGIQPAVANPLMSSATTPRDEYFSRNKCATNGAATAPWRDCGFGRFNKFLLNTHDLRLLCRLR